MITICARSLNTLVRWDTYFFGRPIVIFIKRNKKWKQNQMKIASVASSIQIIFPHFG